MNTSDGGSPYLWRNARLLKTVATAVAILSVILFNAMLILRTWSIRSPASQILDVPDSLLPGQEFPHHCDYLWESYYPSDVVYCRNTINNVIVFAEYSNRRQRLTRLAYTVNDVTAGDLILWWGKPTGMRQYGWGVQVFWENRSAWFATHPFSPTSKAIQIAYSIDVPETKPWRGFAN